MAAHQHDGNAGELRHYFQSLIAWVKATFPDKRKEMRSVDRGALYNEFGTKPLNPTELKKEVDRLIQDEDVEKKSGIYPYVLNGEERLLNIRAFSPNMKREAYERQKGKCLVCKMVFPLEEMEADHIDPWHSGGRTAAANCQMRCKPNNRRKSGK